MLSADLLGALAESGEERGGAGPLDGYVRMCDVSERDQDEKTEATLVGYQLLGPLVLAALTGTP